MERMRQKLTAAQSNNSSKNLDMTPPQSKQGSMQPTSSARHNDDTVDTSSELTGIQKRSQQIKKNSLINTGGISTMHLKKLGQDSKKDAPGSVNSSGADIMMPQGYKSVPYGTKPMMVNQNHLAGVNYMQQQNLAHQYGTNPINFAKSGNV